MTTLQNLQYTALRTFVNLSLLWRRSSWMSPATQPTRTQVFANRHDLFAARVFSPSDMSPDERLPLVIDVHGGGFMLNNPSADDPLNRRIADSVRCIVVSLDYRKSPSYRFPAAHEDIVQQTLAILDGVGLAFDPRRVVLIGSSAGGNLVLGAALQPSLRGRVLGLIGIYPVCDLIPSMEEKMATRPDPAMPDFLGEGYAGMVPIYLGPEQETIDLRDMRLSPTYFATRDQLPRHILFVGAEHDLLCHEAQVMAEKLAGDAKKEENEFGWQAGSVQWRLTRGQMHAYDHVAAKDPDSETRRLAATEESRAAICDWLHKLFSTAE